MKFSRFGGLSAVRQKHYVVGEDKSFHNPPRRKGVYAFVYGYEESFLLGGDKDRSKGYSQTIKNRNGEKLYTKSDEYGNILEKNYKGDLSLSNSYWKTWVNNGEESHPLEDQKERNFYKYYSSLITFNPDGTKTELSYKPCKRKVFEYNGEIWYHIDYKIKKEEILDRHGSWVKTSIKTFEKAFNRYRLNNKLKDTGGNLILKTSSKNGHYCLDELEVFIEHVK